MSQAEEGETPVNKKIFKEALEPKAVKDKEYGFFFYVFVFVLTCLGTFAGLTMKNYYDKTMGFSDSGDSRSSKGKSFADCPLFNNINKVPKNTQGIEHCIINAPFDEEIYKFTYWPNYKEFKEKYDGKFEVIVRQMSHPINITFFDKEWKEVEAHSIHEMAADDIADLIRSKGFYENADKDEYKNKVKKEAPML